MTSHRSQKLYIDQVLHDRLEMAETACAELPRCGITKLMAEMGDAGWGAEYFDALQALLAGVSSSGDGASSSDAVNISWVIGYDVLEGMQWWKEKARVLLSKCARLVVVARGTSAEAEILGTAEAVMGRPRAEFEAAGLQLVVLLDRTDSYKRTSSSAIRRHLVALLDLVPLPVLRRIVSDDGLISFYRSIHAEKDVRTDCATRLARPVLRKRAPAKRCARAFESRRSSRALASLASPTVPEARPRTRARALPVLCRRTQPVRSSPLVLSNRSSRARTAPEGSVRGPGPLAWPTKCQPTGVFARDDGGCSRLPFRWRGASNSPRAARRQSHRQRAERRILRGPQRDADQKFE
mmetsp:Transcript_4481/g.10324  ORF Transcript_4481/g.10324 Transcript_4481/m.10324 type:complete len:352 (-) Transcript_4481:228-1283(-)